MTDTKSDGMGPSRPQLVTDVEVAAQAAGLRQRLGAAAEDLTAVLLRAEQAFKDLRLGTEVRIVMMRYGDPEDPGEEEIEWLAFVKRDSEWQLRIRRDYVYNHHEPGWIADDHVKDASLEKRGMAARHLPELLAELLAATERRIAQTRDDVASVESFIRDGLRARNERKS